MPDAPPTILVADDDDDIRDFITIKLVRAQLRVLGASDGVEALRILDSGEPDLGVIDITMPGKSGLDVVRETRARGASQDIPLILLTARAQQADVDLGYAAGATDYVTKPFSPQELLIRINTILGL